MSRFDEMTEEEEEEVIKKAANSIYERNLDAPAIYLLEMIRPLAYIGGQMSRIFISPYLLLFGESFSQSGEKLIKIFQKKENIEKLQILLEKKVQEEKEKKEIHPSQKKGWRKLLHF